METKETRTLEHKAKYDLDDIGCEILGVSETCTMLGISIDGADNISPEIVASAFFSLSRHLERIAASIEEFQLTQDSDVTLTVKRKTA